MSAPSGLCLKRNGPVLPFPLPFPPAGMQVGWWGPEQPSWVGVGYSRQRGAELPIRSPLHTSRLLHGREITSAVRKRPGAALLQPTLLDPV